MSSRVNLATVCYKAACLGAVILSTLIGLAAYDGVVRTACVYAVAVSTFHMLEFLSTSIFNPTQVDDDLFILTDTDLHAVYAATMVELAVEHYFGFAWPLLVRLLGLGIMITGQLSRTLAMYTARESFNHYIQRTKDENHKLVTHGIYSWTRHPSYAGFFWWFIGTQLWCGNPVVLAFGAYKLWLFFKQRIEYEESLLLNFFGDYKTYKKNTNVLIPGIP